MQQGNQRWMPDYSNT